MRVLRSVSGAEGFNIGMNQGDVAGRRASPPTCTSTSCRAGPATRTSCRSSAAPRRCPSCWGTPATLLAEAWASPGAVTRRSPTTRAWPASWSARPAGWRAGCAPGGIDAEQKTSVSDLVTAADKAAERLVVDRLRAERPDDAIVGEEGTDHPAPAAGPG